KIEQSTYIIVLTKDEEKLFDPITTGWKIIVSQLSNMNGSIDLTLEDEPTQVYEEY
ncbi:4466_t:CDS:2, partial [Entrophospora sp. SA101]